MLKTIAIVAAAAIFFAGTYVAWSYWRLSAQIDADVGRLVTAARPAGTIVTEAMLASLPEPARRYLSHSGVIGKPIPSVVRVMQRGQIRNAADAGWMNLEAEETYTTDPPGFVWRAAFPTRALPFVLGRDLYVEGSGSILMKMAAVVPVAAEHGPELGEAGLMRYLNEMMWFPAAFLGPNVTLAPADRDSFTATIADRGLSATATVFVNAEGNITNFRALRFNTATRSIETWETPIGAYGEFGGLLLPARGSAVWKVPGGDFTYIELDILDVVADPPP